MSIDFRTLNRLATALLLVTALVAQADATRPSGTFTDQFEQSHDLSACRQLLLFAPDRDAAGIAEQALEGLDGAAMQRRGICYLADISRMPGLITKMFALPALRERAYPVLLGREEGDTAGLPRREGHLSVLNMAAGRSESPAYVNDATAARALLEQLAPAIISAQ